MIIWFICDDTAAALSLFLHFNDTTNYTYELINMIHIMLIYIFRRLSSGSSDTLESTKMHAKAIILSQWKLINELKSYFSKFTTDKTVEIALNKEFAQFLQKIDAKSYGNDLVRYLTSITVGISRKLEMTDVKQEQGKISLPNLLSELVNGKADEKKEVIPKWKVARTLASKVYK